MKMLFHSLLLIATLAACADEVEVPPDFATRMTRHYGGEDLREAFLNAGVPLEASDKLDFIPSKSKLVFEAGELANNLIRAISLGIPSPSSDLEPERVRTILAGKTSRLGSVTLNGVRLPHRLNFLPDSSAVELDPPHWRAAKYYRWGVNQRGEVELRDQSGTLVLTGQVSATHTELLVSLPLKPTVISVPMESADTARK